MTISYSANQKKVKDNTEKVLLQEIEALELNFIIDLNISDEKNALENLRKKTTRTHYKVSCHLIEQGETPLDTFVNKNL